MTDNEIIQALHCCNNGWCDRCPYHGREDVSECREQSGADLLDLIKRQQAEIEHLNGVVTTTAECAYESRQMAMKWARAEAIQEFAERLKKKYEFHIICDWRTLNGEIDDLVKEMVGDNNA